jgi:hypothetical protein
MAIWKDGPAWPGRRDPSTAFRSVAVLTLCAALACAPVAEPASDRHGSGSP